MPNVRETRWKARLACVAALLAAAALTPGCKENPGGSPPANGTKPGGAAPAAPAPPPALVRVGLVKLEEVEQKKMVVGRLEAVRRSIVASEESGRVLIAPPEAGVTVKSGQVVAKLDDTLLKVKRLELDAGLKEAEPMIAERKAELQLAERKMEHVKKLAADMVANRKELDDALDEYAVSVSRFKAAEAAKLTKTAMLAEVDERLAKMTIKAPFDGVIVRKVAEVGQWMGAGDPAMEIISTGIIDAQLDVPESLIARLIEQPEVEVNVDAVKAVRKGKVDRIIPDGNRQSRTFSALARLQDEKNELKPGMSVWAHLASGLRNKRLTVPRDSVQMTPTGPAIFIVRGGLAIMLPVMIAQGAGERFVVDAEIREGEPVVIEGNIRLRTGQAVKIVEGGGLNPGGEKKAAESPEAPPKK